MKSNKIKSVIKTIGFPLVFSVRAYRSYNYIQYLRRNVLGGKIKVRTIIPDGVFTVDVRSALANLAFTGKYEEELMGLLADQRIEDGLIVNIGANIGFYAVQLARVFPNHAVLAIEPNREAFELLTDNIAQNGLSDRIRSVNACVSDIRGTVSLSCISGKAEYSSIGSIVHTSARNEKQTTVEVDGFPLGDFVENKKVSMIVMDVEGAEYMVLHGAKELISEFKPLILCECEEALLNKFGHSSEMMIQLLQRIGYHVMDARNTNDKFVYPFAGNIIAKYTGVSKGDSASTASDHRGLIK